MDERSIVTPSDLDAAIRAQESRRWDMLWAEAQETGLNRQHWIALAFAGLMALLYAGSIVVDPSARNRFLDALPQLGLLSTVGMAVLGVYVNHTSRQVRALRKLLHGVLAETATLPQRGHGAST